MLVNTSGQRSTSPIVRSLSAQDSWCSRSCSRSRRHGKNQLKGAIMKKREFKIAEEVENAGGDYWMSRLAHERLAAATQLTIFSGSRNILARNSRSSTNL